VIAALFAGCAGTPTGGSPCMSDLDCKAARVCVQGSCVEVATDAGVIPDAGAPTDAGTQPDAGKQVDAGTGCTPNCGGKSCGSDGCGGSCGTCDALSCLSCSSGACLSRCNGAQTCTAGTCVSSSDAGSAGGVDAGAQDAGPLQCGSQVLFQSNWTTALGATDSAIRDTNAACGPWTEWNDGGDHLLSVVAGGPPGYANALRVQQRGGSATAWGDVRKNPFMAAANTDYYLRYYFMTNDVAGCSQDHGVEPWIVASQYLDLTYLDKDEGPSGWGLRLVIGGNATDGHGGPYPIFNWFLVGQNSRPLSYGVWYRLEYWVHFTSTNHIQVHPRVYDASSALLYQDSDFVQEDYGSTLYNGFNDWTLALWYSRASGAGTPTYGDFQVNGSPDSLQAASTLQSLLFGNNGSGSSVDTGLYWYYAGVQARSDTWCGP
jgi:hypothetical protein